MKKENKNTIRLVTLTAVVALFIGLGVGVNAERKHWVGYEVNVDSEVRIGEIDSLLAKLREKAGDNEYFLEQIKILETQLEHQNTLIDGRDKSIVELQEQVIERDKIIEDLRVIIETQDEDLQEALEQAQLINKLLHDINLEE